LIDHSQKATKFAYGFSKLFTNQARKNTNKFESKRKENQNNIWSLAKPVITPGVEEI